ncbi:MAG: hypothetical protein KGD58_14845 [Candidatus Lokiarchaeota archaeon]|nr:hypothetical protein [Candidatus Lokiarchaeota archaeon]
MNLRFVLNRIKRKLHSQIKLRDVMRKVCWLEFENEIILSFLEKYNIATYNQQPPINTRPKIQDFVGIENEPEFIINVIESSHS